MMTTPVAETQTICAIARVARVTRCDSMSLVAYENDGEEPGEDGQHRASLPERAAAARPGALRAPPRRPARIATWTTTRQLPVAASWFSVTWVTGRTAVITEPHVDEFLQGNIWYLRGRERDLLVDTGNGIAPLRPVLARFSRSERPREIVALATHAHADHIGGFHEFERRLLHPAEANAAARAGDEPPLLTATWVAKLGAQLADDGTASARPRRCRSRMPASTRPPSASPPPPRRTSSQGGDVIDLGGRCSP